MLPNLTAVRLMLVDAGQDGQQELLPEAVRRLEITIGSVYDLM